MEKLMDLKRLRSPCAVQSNVQETRGIVKGTLQYTGVTVFSHPKIFRTRGAKSRTFCTQKTWTRWVQNVRFFAHRGLRSTFFCTHGFYMIKCVASSFLTKFSDRMLCWHFHVTLHQNHISPLVNCQRSNSMYRRQLFMFFTTLSADVNVWHPLRKTCSTVGFWSARTDLQKK